MPKYLKSFISMFNTGSSKSGNDPGYKLPLKRFEPALYRFTKIALPTDLDRLERHKYNIEKVSALKLM